DCSVVAIVGRKHDEPFSLGVDSIGSCLLKRLRRGHFRSLRPSSTCNQRIPLMPSFLLEKAKGMATVRSATSGTIAMKPTDFPAIADIRMACVASMAIEGTQAL